MYFLALIASILALWYLLVWGGGVLESRGLLSPELVYAYEIVRDAWSALLDRVTDLLSWFF